MFALKDNASLDEVAVAQARLEQARTQLHEAVTRARAHDHTWAQIGDVLGMTRQAAFKRFGSPGIRGQERTCNRRRPGNWSRRLSGSSG